MRLRDQHQGLPHGLRWGVVALLMCMPVLALVYQDEAGHWVVNRSAFISPDEMSYLLVANHLGNLGPAAESFYPVGFPALLALWGKLADFSLVSFHVLLTLLGSASVLAIYVLVRWVLGVRFGTAGFEWGALAITGLYASSYHVLENLCSVFAEPAFVLITVLWLILALRWERWWEHVGRTLVLALLAAAAASMRSAGIVCFASLLAYPAIQVFWVERLRHRENRSASPLLVAAAIVLAVMLPYYLLTGHYFPVHENSYAQQLINGTIGKAHTVGDATQNLADNLRKHLDDFSQMFLPPARESPRFGPYNVIGKMLLALAMAGFLPRLLCPERKGQVRPCFLELYILFYMGLYAVWPFDFVRFWFPILPVMLMYAWLAILQRPAEGRWLPLHKVLAPALAALLVLLLLTLNAQEILLKLGFYQQRLEYVSSALRAVCPAIEKTGGNASNSSLVSNDRQAMEYYCPLPAPLSTAKESDRTLILRLLSERTQESSRPKRIYVAYYFDTADALDLLSALAPKLPTGWRMRTIYRRDYNVMIVAEIAPLANSD